MSTVPWRRNRKGVRFVARLGRFVASRSRWTTFRAHRIWTQSYPTHYDASFLQESVDAPDRA